MSARAAGSPPPVEAVGGEETSAARAHGAASTEALALAARAGDRGAFDALVLRLEGALVRYLRARTGSQPDAEELAQEAFLKAWEALERYDPRWRFTTWLYAIASRLATSHARRMRPEAGETRLAALAAESDPAARAGSREERLGLWGLAERVCSPEQRAALWLRYAEDLPAEDIARALGKRAVTVRVLLFRARARLADHLDASRFEDPTTPPAAEAAELLARRASGGTP